MNCTDFREIIDSYLSDELLTETNHEIMRHLEQCTDCGMEIEARRFVRERLRSAVRRAPEFEVSQRFQVKLREELRTPNAGAAKSGPGFFGFRAGWIPAAVGLIFVIGVGLALMLQIRTGETPPGSEPLVLASALPSDHIVNVAAGDHDMCAVKHGSNRPAVAVADVSTAYRDLAKVVKDKLDGVLENCDLVDSHSCKFGKQRFSHVVLRYGGEMVSVLVTDEEQIQPNAEGKIFRFASDKYSISQFDLANREVFVISQLDNARNAAAAEALSDPLKLHYSKPSAGNVQTALLFAR